VYSRRFRRLRWSSHGSGIEGSRRERGTAAETRGVLRSGSCLTAASEPGDTAAGPAAAVVSTGHPASPVLAVVAAVVAGHIAAAP